VCENPSRSFNPLFREQVDISLNVLTCRWLNRQPYKILVWAFNKSNWHIYDFHLVIFSQFILIPLVKSELEYQVGNQRFRLRPGDRLIFNAPQPHCWQNSGVTPAPVLLVFKVINPNQFHITFIQMVEPGKKIFSVNLSETFSTATYLPFD